MKNDRIVMGIITVYTGVGPIFRKEYGKDCISEKPALMRSRKQEKKLANKRIHLAGRKIIFYNFCYGSHKKIEYRKKK